MDYTEIILEAATTLTVNKLRTGLAILGIVIGIGSVITLVSLGQSTQQAVQNQIQSLGSNLLTVNPGAQNSGAVQGARGSATTLTNEDAAALQNSPEITLISQISPEYTSNAQITTSSTNTNTRIIGAVPEYAQVHNITVQVGQFISASDQEQTQKIAVLGPTTASTLFGDSFTAIGKTIRLNGQVLRVVGVTESKGGTGFSNQDDAVYVPLSTAQKQLFGVNYLSSIALQVSQPELMTAAQNQVGYFLLARHQISDPSEADFSIFSQADILETASSTTSTFTTLLSGVAAISLIVGGIGIMNIMLVTVTERTREIGLRKALGAKKQTIVIQFLIESIILTFVGGILGVSLGVGASLLYSALANTTFILSFSAVVLAFFVSSCIGLIFGWYPAQRAAQLQPIEALRYE